MQMPMQSYNIGFPKIVPPPFSFLLVIAAGIHLEPESKKEVRNVDFHTAKRQATFFLFLLPISYNMNSDLFNVV